MSGASSSARVAAVYSVLQLRFSTELSVRPPAKEKLARAQGEDGAREALRRRAAGAEVAAAFAAVAEAAVEFERDAGDEGGIGGDLRQRGRRDGAKGSLGPGYPQGQGV